MISHSNPIIVMKFLFTQLLSSGRYIDPAAQWLESTCKMTAGYIHKLLGFYPISWVYHD